MSDFDLRFNEDFEPDDEAPGRAVEHLPPPPEIGGSPGYSDIPGPAAIVVCGGSTTPPLFPVSTLCTAGPWGPVWKIENGVPVGLGAIDATASEDDLVRHFMEAMPKPGEGKAVFKVRPIDGDGREMGMEAPIIIGEHHAALQRHRRVSAAGAASLAQGVAASHLPTDVLRLMERAIDQTRASLDAERHRSRDLMEQIADERMNVASNATTSIQAMSEKMLDAEAQRARMSLESAGTYHQQAADNQAAFFQTQMDLLRQDREREGERSERERMGAEERFARTLAEMEMQRSRQAEEAERRRREERETWERRMEEMRLETTRRTQEQEAQRRTEVMLQERRWKQEQIEREEREKNRQRDHEMKLRQMELEQGQQREHAERMMQLQQAQLAATMAQAAGKGGGVKGTIKEITGVLAMLGMEPRDVLDRFFAPGGAGEGGAPGGAAWAELAGKLMGTVGEVAKAKMIADAHKGRPAAAVNPRQIARIDPRQMPPPGRGAMLAPPEPGEWDEDDDDALEDMGEISPPLARRAPIRRREVRRGPRARLRERRGARAPEPAEPPPSQAPGGVALSVQRDARKALRTLVNRLQVIPREEWDATITGAIASTPAIYTYCQQKTVQGAIMEAGGDPGFALQIIAILRESPLVPADMNYGNGGES